MPVLQEAVQSFLGKYSRRVSQSGTQKSHLGEDFKTICRNSPIIPLIYPIFHQIGRQCISYGNRPSINGKAYTSISSERLGWLKPNCGHMFNMLTLVTWPSLITSSGNAHFLRGHKPTANTAHATKTCDTPNDASAHRYDHFWVPIAPQTGFDPILPKTIDFWGPPCIFNGCDSEASQPDASNSNHKQFTQ